MHHLKGMTLVLLAVAFCALTGCGGSGSGTFNPTPADPPAAAAAAASTSFTNVSTASGKAGMKLCIDRSSIDSNVGQLLATATVLKSDGQAISGLEVDFSIAAGPATIVPNQASATTDSNGVALATIIPGNVLTTTNVIVQAAATINGQTARVYAPFQIVRGTGVITFITGKTTTDPDGTLNTLDKTLDSTFAGSLLTFMQQIPFKVTDANGNPRVGVPVTLSVDNQLTNRASIGINNPTVTTDSMGKGIFNVSVGMIAPPVGVTFTDSIIYKAVSAEALGTPQLLTYGGFIVSVTTKYSPLVITPSTAVFGATTDVAFSISGGVGPYRVTSSNPAQVRVDLQADGSTVIAHLVDTAATSISVTISATDAAGSAASATISK